MEVIGGPRFIGCGIRYGCGSLGLLSMRGTVMLIYFGILLVVALIDWDTQIIYDRFHIFILILAIANIWLVPGAWACRQAGIGALIISVPMLLLALVIPGAFGGEGYQINGGFRSISWDRTGSVRHVFGAVDRRRLRSIYAKEQEIRKKKMYLHSDHFLHSDWRLRLYGDQIVTWYLHFFIKESNEQLLKR